MVQFAEGCLWEQLTPQHPLSPVLTGERNADVCIIGAGFTGLSAALQLLEGGKSVCVVEAHQVGHGGSGRNVGLVNAGTWVAPDELEKTLGSVEASRLNTALGAARRWCLRPSTSTASIVRTPAPATCTWRTTPRVLRI